MIPHDVIVSHHAWWRFVSRWEIYCGKLPSCPMGAFSRLLAKAVKVNLGAGAVKRILANKEPASYYEAEGWRFVLNEDGNRMITVERVWFNRPRPKKGRKPWYR